MVGGRCTKDRQRFDPALGCYLLRLRLQWEIQRCSRQEELDEQRPTLLRAVEGRGGHGDSGAGVAHKWSLTLEMGKIWVSEVECT